MTDFYQGAVGEYLRANRSTFINTEYVLQLDRKPHEPPKGTFWYADFLALDTENKTAFLCEVSYARNFAALIRRLSAWAQHWSEIEASLYRDAHLSPAEWKTRVWIFIPDEFLDKGFLKRLPTLPTPPRITPLEMTQPWKYSDWNRVGERPKPPIIPPEMQ